VGDCVGVTESCRVAYYRDFLVTRTSFTDYLLLTRRLASKLLLKIMPTHSITVTFFTGI